MNRDRVCFAVIVMALAAPLVAGQTNAPAVPAAVHKIFRTICTDCHSGTSPAAGLNLDISHLPASILDKPSSEKPDFKIADSASPEKSYILLKLRGAAGISGSRMPRGRNKLSDSDIQSIADWLAGLKPPAAFADEAKRNPEKPSFWGVSLANLPTTTTIEGGRFLFRVAHRFFPSVQTGLDTFFGMDGPGAIQLSFGYGLSDRLSVTLGRTNQYQELDLAVHYKMLEQIDGPFGLAVHVGSSLATATLPNRTSFSSKNIKAHVELSLSYRLTERVSLLVVPAYVSNANYWVPDRDGTFAVGLGGRWMFLDDISFIAEWIPVLAGYAADAHSWTLGLEKKIGGHVFQVFVLNAVGSTPGQYFPGVDLRIQNDSHLRIGFNIYRSF